VEFRIRKSDDKIGDHMSSMVKFLYIALSGLFLLWLITSPLTRSAQQLAISGPATCQQGQSCTYTATGGLGPYTFSMVEGSVGSITATGVYTSPAHVVPKQVINGCQGTPNNSVFNTRIDALPVHPNSSIWLSNADPGPIYYVGSLRLHGSTVLSTDPPTQMSFYYTPQANGPFIFAPFPNTLAQSGTDVPRGLIGLPGRDDHVITTYRDVCKQTEIYQLYETNIAKSNPGGNSQAGVIYSLINFVHPGYGTDAALTYLSPLTVHLDELVSAQAGNMDAIQHAVRMTEDVLSIDASVGIWPAQDPGGHAACRAGQTWTVSADGTPTVTGTGFSLDWPAGTPVIINNSNYTVASVNNNTSITLKTPVRAGSYSMSLPHSDCAPYGARFRLKSSFAWPGFDNACATKACQNVVNALLRSQKLYGLVLADVGPNGDVDYDGGQYTSTDIGNALREIFFKLPFNKDNFEAVDESVLNTSQGGGVANQQWLEAKLNNGFMTPDDGVVIKVTDSNATVAYYGVALQGLALGVPNPIEVVMAGASPVQFFPWVTGSSNTGYSCSLSPSGGANGTITSRCLYTPPSTEEVSTWTNTTVTITAAADSTATKTFQITILPVAADGNLYISLGKATYPTPTYTDNNGIVWWNDMPPDQPLGLVPDYGAWQFTGSWTGANSAESPGIYAQGEMAAPINDMHFSIWVPNGSVTGTVYLVNIAPSANRQGFSFDCNGKRVIDVSDTFTYTGSKGPRSAAPLTCTTQVTDSRLHMVLRWQGVNLQADPCCNAPIYHTSIDGVWAAGLVVSPGGPRPRRPPRAPGR
jgi:hypothetical protein